MASLWPMKAKSGSNPRLASQSGSAGKMAAEGHLVGAPRQRWRLHRAQGARRPELDAKYRRVPWKEQREEN